MPTYLWISLGAIAGASARYFVSRFVTRSVSSSFPYGTLMINVSGIHHTDYASTCAKLAVLGLPLE